MAPLWKRRVSKATKRAVSSEALPASADACAPTAPSPPVNVSPDAPPSKTFVVRVWDAGVLPRNNDPLAPELAKRLSDGDRLFLQGWNGGAPTGRARLMRLERGQWEHSWGWSRGAEDPTAALAPLSLKPEIDVFPVVGECATIENWS